MSTKRGYIIRGLLKELREKKDGAKITPSGCNGCRGTDIGVLMMPVVVFDLITLNLFLRAMGMSVVVLRVAVYNAPGRGKGPAAGRGQGGVFFLFAIASIQIV